MARRGLSTSHPPYRTHEITYHKVEEVINQSPNPNNQLSPQRERYRAVGPIPAINQMTHQRIASEFNFP